MRYFLCLLLFLAGQGAAAAKSALELDLLTFEQMPYIHVDAGGRATGAAVEMIDELFARMRIKPQLRFYPLARALALIDHGDGDGIFTVRKTRQRAAHYHYSKMPLFAQEMVVFVRKGAPIVYTGALRDLAGHSLGLVRGASYGDVIDGAVAAQLFSRTEYVSAPEQNFRKLIAGRVDMVVSGKENGWAILRKLGLSDSVKIAGQPVEMISSYMMFSRGSVDTAFMRKLNHTMAMMQRDGSACRIMVKYGLR
jgi:polar amino acid transport system substrate-binding protein